MSDGTGAPQGQPADEPRPAGTPGTVALLLDAVGRLLHYGGELIVLEARAAGRTAVSAVVLAVFAALCVLTGWLAFNAGLVWLLHGWLTVNAGFVLLGAAGVNALLAVLVLWRARRRLRELGRSPLKAFIDSQRG